MKVDLVAEVPVVRLAAFAELALLERRPELGLLCRSAREADGRITVALVQRVLPGTSEPAARNITRWCEHLNLCDRRGGLTGVGHSAADSDFAPVPEQGVYDLWIAEHPLLGARILHAHRLVSTRDQRFDDIQPVPVLPDSGVVFTSLIDPAQQLVLRSFMSNHGEAVCLRWSGTTSRIQLRWRWDMDSASNTWTLDGRLDAGKKGGRSVQHGGESADVDVWGLFSALAHRTLSREGRWDEADRCLGVAFDRLSTEQIESFEKRFELEGADVAGFGHFTSILIEGVPLKPRNAQDAQAWAQARLHRRLERGTAYHSREDVRRLWARLVEGTSLEPFGPSLPSHHQLLAGADDQPAVYWSLAAPVDLAPEPVPQDALETMDVHRVEARPETTPGAVRVPHRAGWSMQDLVGRLVDDDARRVVLCDRFVRGDDNLRMLELMSATVRQEARNASLEVVTDRVKDGADNIAAIRSRTGKQPRTYNDVFGSSRREHPHDRYLLVEGSDGAFAWQMSNSPLDARADNGTEPTPSTPLRWRDLSATRLSLDELPAGLARLVGGGA